MNWTWRKASLWSQNQTPKTIPGPSIYITYSILGVKESENGLFFLTKYYIHAYIREGGQKALKNKLEKVFDL